MRRSLAVACCLALLCVATAEPATSRKLLGGSRRKSYANAIALLGNGSYGLTIDGDHWVFSQYSAIASGGTAAQPYILDVGGVYNTAWSYAKTASSTACGPGTCVYGQEMLGGSTIPLVQTTNNAANTTYQPNTAAAQTPYWGFEVFTAAFPGIVSVSCASPAICTAVGAAQTGAPGVFASGGLPTAAATGTAASPWPNYPTMLQTTDGGFSWSFYELPLSNGTNTSAVVPIDLNKVYYATASVGWAVGGDYYGNNGRIYYTGNGGASWTEQYPAEVAQYTQMYQVPQAKFPGQTSSETFESSAFNVGPFTSLQGGNGFGLGQGSSTESTHFQALYVPVSSCAGDVKQNNITYLMSPFLCYQSRTDANNRTFYVPTIPNILSVSATGSGKWAYAVTATGNSVTMYDQPTGKHIGNNNNSLGFHGYKSGTGTGVPGHITGGNVAVLGNQLDNPLPVILAYQPWAGNWAPLNYTIQYCNNAIPCTQNAVIVAGAYPNLYAASSFHQYYNWTSANFSAANITQNQLNQAKYGASIVGYSTGSYPSAYDFATDLYSISVASRNVVYAAGGNFIITTTNGGYLWTLTFPLGPALNIVLNNLISLNPNASIGIAPQYIDASEQVTSTEGKADHTAGPSNMTYAKAYANGTSTNVTAGVYTPYGTTVGYMPPAWNFVYFKNEFQGFIGGSNGTFNWFLQTSNGGQSWDCVQDNNFGIPSGPASTYVGMTAYNYNLYNGNNLYTSNPLSMVSNTCGSGLSAPYNVFGAAVDSNSRVFFHSIDTANWGPSWVTTNVSVPYDTSCVWSGGAPGVGSVNVSTCTGNGCTSLTQILGLPPNNPGCFYVNGTYPYPNATIATFTGQNGPIFTAGTTAGGANNQNTALWTSKPLGTAATSYVWQQDSYGGNFNETYLGITNGTTRNGTVQNLLYNLYGVISVASVPSKPALAISKKK